GRADGWDLAAGGARDRERSREARDVADRSEEVARGELGRLVDLARRVGRCEHQVGLDRDLVQLLHGVAGEVGRDRGFDGPELLVARRVLVEGGPVAADERVGARYVVIRN